MKFYLHDNTNEVLVFAASELQKYLAKIAGLELTATTCPDEADFLLGGSELPENKWDDAFLLKSRNGKLHLAGSNARSVLFAVYDFLENLGCRWTAPGIDTLPSGVQVDLTGWDKLERASSRYRGYAVCGAGDTADSMPYMTQMIDWMLKQKCNLYFSEGFPLECPGDQWSCKDGVRPLQHIEHACGDWSLAERNALLERKEQLIRLARSRGMLIERYGHGWAAGIIEHFAEINKISLQEARKRLRAKGKISHEEGELGKSTMWFQFCMSEPGLRELYIEHVVDYLKKHHSDADIAAFWLGDGYDNACLCPRCVEKPFSEWYMDIFQEIVREVGKFAPELRFEGLIYFMTMEPPTSHWLDDIDSVDFIIAPWNRCYRHRLDAQECRNEGWSPDFRNNASHDFENSRRPLNHDVGEAIRGWRAKIRNFHTRMFEYYSLSCEPGRHRLSYDATDLARDIRDFTRLGIEGSVSCESMYTDLPFFLIHHVSTALMWNPQADEKKIRQTLARDLFGKDADRVLEAADQVATLLLQHNEHGKTPQPVRQAIFDELGNIAKSIADLPLPTLAVLTLAWIYAIETDAEAECLNKLLELLEKQKHKLEKFCDCKTLQKRYQFRLDEISK
ncbi:MAG: DUF4838 domain-containing protein [Lentisphaerae bacterium]|jgi:hypothetical protein|nr:DUF4838 domain-containing protein [Lentisphaerota bacterium]